MVASPRIRPNASVIGCQIGSTICLLKIASAGSGSVRRKVGIDVSYKVMSSFFPHFSRYVIVGGCGLRGS